jgi:hypothetical protein
VGIGSWGEGIIPGSDEKYLLVRRNKEGTLQGISFTRGIVSHMDITENEWKDLDKTVSEDL